eukprot:TRINITY_DN838_c0_g2_i1.p1 TRINITY_DN838_c0_g2~~TRINITY_DN838_c0_g2_i1.p1  ORF type:complete len:1050 (+),score=313.76 TRINITY_DN838_c0_g2_i1:104-3253(+)
MAMQRGSLAQTYSAGARPSSAATNKLTVEIMGAAGLSPPGGDALCPIVRLTHGVTSFDSPVGALSGEAWSFRGCSLVFPLDAAGKLQALVLHRPEGGAGDVELGTAAVALTGSGVSERTLQLQGKGGAPAGELRLKITILSQAALGLTAPQGALNASINSSGSMLPPPEEDDDYGTLKFEIVRIKGMVMPEDWLSIAPLCVLSFEGADIQTKPQKSLAPYFNHKGEVPVKTPDEPLVFTVYDLDDGPAGSGKLRFYGVAGYNFTRDADWKEQQLEIELLDALDQLEVGQDKGTLLVRLLYRVNRKRLKAAEDAERPRGLAETGLIELDYVPEIHGGVPIVPDDCKYIWYNILNDHKYQVVVEQRIMEAYLAEHMKATASPGRPRAGRASIAASSPEAPKEKVPITMDTVVVREWKCTRLRHALDILRICAERVSSSESLPVPEEELHQRRVKLKEGSLMREKVIADSPTIMKDMRQRLWYLFAGGKEEQPQPEESVFGELHFKAIYYTYAQTFLHGVSTELAKRFADEEWQEEGWDDMNKLFKSRDASGKGTKLAGMPDERFCSCCVFAAAFWCDTLTEHELRQILTVMTPLFLEARKLAQKWAKGSKRRQSRKVVTKDNWRQVEHLDQLGRRRRKSEQPGAGAAGDDQGGGGGGGGRRKSTKRASVAPGSDAAAERPLSAQGQPRRRTSKAGGDDDAVAAAQRALQGIESPNASAGRRRSTKKGGSGSFRKKPKNPEDKVREAFDMEDLDWGKFAAYVKEVFGGFDSRPPKLLNLGESEIQMIIQRQYGEAWTKKHKRTQSELTKAIKTFFEAIKPEPVPDEKEDPRLGNTGMLTEMNIKLLMTFCHTNPLKKLLMASQFYSQLGAPILRERIHHMHPDPGYGRYEEDLKVLISEEVCISIRQQVGTGKFKTPSRLLQVLGDMVCALLGIESGGYWAKFKEMICQKNSHEQFSNFDLSTMSHQRFQLCGKLKKDSDRGVDKKTGKPLQQMNIITMTEKTCAQHFTPEFVLVYRWVKTLMEYYGRYAGTETHAEKYGWRLPTDHQVYWD